MKTNNERIEEALKFMKSQKSINKKNIKTISKMGFAVDDMKEWDKIYSYIIKILKSMRK